MKKILNILFLSNLLFSQSIFSAEIDTNQTDAFSIDRPFPNKNLTPFFNTDNTEPKLSSFTITNQFFLSNKFGQRQAVITLNNPAGARRILIDKQIMAVFANGDKAFPREISLKIPEGSTITYTFDFGTHSFPIIFVYTSNSLNK